MSDRSRPLTAERGPERARGQAERGARPLGDQAGQWRWRTGRELWGAAAKARIGQA